MTTIFDLIRSGELEELGRLLADRPDQARARDENGLSAVLHARYHGRTEMVHALLATGVELDVFEAAALGAGERLAALVRADPALVHAWSPDGFTPLHLAAFFGRADAVQVLLAVGADADVASRNAMAVTPLHSAAAGGHAAIVELLLAAGAAATARQSGGWTALHSAAANGDRAAIVALLRHGAVPDAVSDDGRTPRQLAVESGHAEVVAQLPS